MCFRPFWQPSSIYSLFIVIINCLLWINKSLSCSYEMWRNYHSRESGPQLGMKANRHNVLLPWQLLVSRAVKRIGYAPLNKPTGSKQTQTRAETNRQTDRHTGRLSDWNGYPEAALSITSHTLSDKPYLLCGSQWRIQGGGGDCAIAPPPLVWPWIFV